MALMKPTKYRESLPIWAQPKCDFEQVRPLSVYRCKLRLGHPGGHIYRRYR